MFSISASFYVIALLYGCFVLPEPRQAPEVVQSGAVIPSKKEKNLLLDFFDKAHVMETFRVAFRKGANRRRERVILLMIVVMVVIGPLYGEYRSTLLKIKKLYLFYFRCFTGEMNVTYLFTRYRFNWSEVEFSIFSTFAVVTGLFGNFHVDERVWLEFFTIVSTSSKFFYFFNPFL